MVAQIDRVERGVEQGEDRLLHRLGLAGEREHRPVVGRVGRSIQQPDAIDRHNGLGDRVDDVRPAALADVRHALNQGHKRL